MKCAPPHFSATPTLLRCDCVFKQSPTFRSVIMNNGIQEKVVVITGASSGIGESTARHLSAKGANLVLGARRLDRLEKLAAELRGAGGKVEVLTTDVTRRQDVAALVKLAVSKFGRIDVLVNNAGI